VRRIGIRAHKEIIKPVLRRDSPYFRYVQTEPPQARGADKNQQPLCGLSRFSQVIKAAANQLATGKFVKIAQRHINRLATTPNLTTQEAIAF